MIACVAVAKADGVARKVSNERILERFLAYCKVESQSVDEPDMSSFPMTEGQKRIARLIYDEVKSLGGWGCASQLAGYYISDEIVPMDLEKVKELCNKAIEEGDTDSGAYFYLGCTYCSHNCTDKVDWKTAAEYFSKGATAGDPYSQYCYSKCLEKGKGVKKDKEQAAYWHNIVAQSEDYDYINGIDWQHDNGIKW